MKKLIIALAAVVAALFTVGCDGDECESNCEAQCASQTPNEARQTCEGVCKIQMCDGSTPEAVSHARQPVSFAATVGLAISDKECACNGVSGGWRSNGITYNDVSARCVALRTASYNSNDYGLVKFAPVSCPSGEVPTKVEVSFATTEWTSGATARLRAVLVEWDPPASVCQWGCSSNNHVGFVYRKAGVAWAGLGASGVGTDVSTTFADITVPSTGTQAHTVDVTPMLLGCATAGTPCSLRWESLGPGGVHYWLASAGAAIHVTCEVPTGGAGGAGGETGAGGAAGGSSGSGGTTGAGGAGGSATGGAGGAGGAGGEACP